MCYHMFIDDLREPYGYVYDPHDPNLIITRTSDEAIRYMADFGCPAYISFDHDLGGDDTAIKVVNWMIERDLDTCNWIPDNFTFDVHSANPVGKENIIGKLGAYLRVRNM